MRERTDELVSAFCSIRSGAVPDGLGEALARACDAARAVDPDLRFKDRELAEAVAARCPSADPIAYLDRCHGADLVRARRAVGGEFDAIASLEAIHRAAIDRVCRRFATTEHTVDDLRQLLRERLFAGPSPAIDRDDGLGRLGSWLRVIATRLFIDLGKRKDRAREVPDRDDLAAALPDPADLGLDLIKAEYRAAARDAIEHAARRLAPGDRLLLREHLVAGLTIDQLGAALGIHRASAARRIAKAREHLVASVRSELGRRLALSPHEMDHVFGLVASRLDVSLARLLATRE